MKIEFGGKWIVLEDNPWGAGVYKGDFVWVYRVSDFDVEFHDERGLKWLGVPDEWCNYMQPYYTPKAINTSSEDSFSPKPDGSVASYYDFPKGMVTLNDWLEYMGDHCWKGDSFHLANIVKAATRWGRKGGTGKEYDARKFIYSGCRLLMKYTNAEEVHNTLNKILQDPQFQPKDKDP